MGLNKRSFSLGLPNWMILIIWLTLNVAQNVGDAIHASSAISIDISTRVGVAPLEVRGRMTIEPNPANRMACLIWDSAEGVAGSSCRQLDGEESPKTNYIWIKGLEAGEYQVGAKLLRNTGEIITSNKIALQVIANGARP